MQINALMGSYPTPLPPKVPVLSNKIESRGAEIGSRAAISSEEVAQSYHSSRTMNDISRRVTVQGQTQTLSYHVDNRETVRIVFGDGSMLVGTFFDAKA
jgi:hypothetical protein